MAKNKNNGFNRNVNAANRKKKPRKRMRPGFRRFWATVGILFSIMIVCASVACIYVLNYAKEYVEGPLVIDLEEYRANQQQTSIIYGYDENNEPVELLRLHGAQNRVWIDYEDIPEDMINAFRDLEDKRFNEHNGVDWVRTIFGVIKNKFKHGGSTITQQLIKNLTGENNRDISRKFYEILNALNLERHYSKKTIMEAYLNTIYLGNGCYGIKTAAEEYFGKDVEDLNVAECASIAVITKAPADYDPFTELDAHTERQQDCLYIMYENGTLSEKEYKKAEKYKLVFTNSEDYKGSQVKEDDESEPEYTEDDVKYTASNESGVASYYVEYVIDKVIADLQEEYDLTYNEAWRKVFFGGLRIYTAIDFNAQAAAEYVYENRITFPEESDTKENPAVQSAMTIMDYSGRVVAMVGGAGIKDTFRGLNRAWDSPRQPGSSIKPLSVYTPVIENNIATWSTKVQNYGIRVGSSRWPVNYGGSYGSANSFVTVQYALQVSYNTVPAQLVKRLGIEPCFDFLVDDLKISTLITDEDDPNYDGNYSSICVGGTSNGVTTLEMTAAYQMFGNNGYYFEPYCYYSVTNNDGSEELLSAGDSKGEQVISESTAGVMKHLLKTVSSSGTGSGYGVNGFENFSKTGTTSDDKDRWYVGGTPYYVAAVWYGYDQPKKITNTSGNPAGKIYREVMRAIHEDLEPKSFPSSDGVVSRRYCTASGDIASAKCASTATGYYRTSKIPATCRNCAMIHAIGSEIPDAATTAQLSTTTEPSTAKKPPKTTKPAKTTNPLTTLRPSTTVPPTTVPPTTAPPTTTVPSDTTVVDMVTLPPEQTEVPLQ
ncbi:MAG: transglycosylase domain-containing protein [Clostridia bacterium]|nr:transglycosylase domain-containing protein [Clostridia bacterium]